MLVVEQAGAPVRSNKMHWWLWVPAFAGTTSKIFRWDRRLAVAADCRRRPGRAKREPGPITTNVGGRAGWSTSPEQQYALVVTGPRVRGDDQQDFRVGLSTGRGGGRSPSSRPSEARAGTHNHRSPCYAELERLSGAPTSIFGYGSLLSQGRRAVDVRRFPLNARRTSSGCGQPHPSRAVSQRPQVRANR
jgi:hypothetical protein